MVRLVSEERVSPHARLYRATLQPQVQRVVERTDTILRERRSASAQPAHAEHTVVQTGDASKTHRPVPGRARQHLDGNLYQLSPNVSARDSPQGSPYRSRPGLKVQWQLPSPAKLPAPAQREEPEQEVRPDQEVYLDQQGRPHNNHYSELPVLFPPDAPPDVMPGSWCFCWTQVPSGWRPAWLWCCLRRKGGLWCCLAAESEERLWCLPTPKSAQEEAKGIMRHMLACIRDGVHWPINAGLSINPECTTRCMESLLACVRVREAEETVEAKYLPLTIEGQSSKDETPDRKEIDLALAWLGYAPNSSVAAAVHRVYDNERETTARVLVSGVGEMIEKTRQARRAAEAKGSLHDPAKAKSLDTDTIAPT